MSTRSDHQGNIKIFQFIQQQHYYKIIVNRKNNMANFGVINCLQSNRQYFK